MASQPELAGPAPTKEGKLLKVTLFLKKLPHVTEEYFHAYWANNHMIPTLRNEKFRQNVVHCNQYHISSEERDQLKVLGLPSPDYDGVVEIWVRSVQDWIDAFTEPTLLKDLDGDAENFFQTPVHMTAGYDHWVIGEAPWPVENFKPST